MVQPAVLDGKIKDVNKVAKFTKATAQTWTYPVLVNPALPDVEGQEIGLTNVDPDQAEASDES